MSSSNPGPGAKTQPATLESESPCYSKTKTGACLFVRPFRLFVSCASDTRDASSTLTLRADSPSFTPFPGRRGGPAGAPVYSLPCCDWCPLRVRFVTNRGELFNTA
eukprot:1172989-Prorocentrum_minimum.AAC.1